METIYLKGNACHTCGQMPRPGQEAPCFNLVGKDFDEIRSKDFRGRKIVLNIFPSIDTPVCAASVRRFNEEAARRPDVTVMNVSMDLPFAQQRFCAAEGIENCIVASAFRSPMFAREYGLQIADGPLAGLLARAVIIIDENNNVTYTDLVEQISDEPDYEAALSML